MKITIPAPPPDGGVWTAAARYQRLEISPPARVDRTTFPVLPHESEHLLNTNLELAIARARSAIAAYPRDPEAQYLLGAALRRKGQNADARAVLEPLTGSQPHMACAWRELGFVLAALGETDDARRVLLHALLYEPIEPDSWYALGDLLSFRSNPSGVPLAEIEDSRINDVEAALRNRRPQAALALLQRFAEPDSSSPRLLKLRGDTLIMARRWDEAKPLLVQCLELCPQYAAARFRWASMLVAHREHSPALPHIDILLASTPDSKPLRHLKALALGGTRQFPAAIAEYEKLLAEDSDGQAGLWLQYVQMVRAVRPEEAVQVLEKVLQMFPDLVAACYMLATIKSFRFSAVWIDPVETKLRRADLSADSRAQLHFVLGKVYEDIHDYDRAFEQFRLSNDAQRRGGVGQDQLEIAYTLRCRKQLTPEFFQTRETAGSTKPGAVFIVGLPRAGSTLVEQILASHSAIEGLGEIGALHEVIETGLGIKLQGAAGDYPGILAALDTTRFRALGDFYMARARALQKRGRPVFTDKLLSNYLHIGLIHLILPEAKIIDVRRHPLDCGLSNFKHFFPVFRPQSLDLRVLGRTYVNYVEHMAHFDAVLPGRVHRVIYEQLVENPEREIRRLLDHLGLPFEEQCLRFYQTDRSVRTISAEQVRMPLYRSAIGHWKNFERWLDPLTEELGEVLASYPDVPGSYPRAMAPLRA